ncbi:hypothetical protein [Psychrobacter pygoscelis]|uniref:phage tail tube protein n=1 Tax=Psychrobacter pygoscelis TaxID=2488563 RepID=UPI00103EFC2A|nr:hypothetical protein [Psychrobacter pygoscelis]
MAKQSHAFIGRGKIYLTPVVNGVEQQEFWVGVASKQTFAHSVTDEKTLYEYHTPNKNEWDSTDGTKEVNVSITLSERRKEAMAAALQATVTTVNTGNVENELHAVSAVGDTFALKYAKVSSVAITDSASPDQPLAENTDYKLDKDFGRIEMLKDGFTGPLKVSYSYGEATKLKPMTNSVDHYIVRTEGLNIAGQKERQIVTAYRVKIKPANAYELISDDFSGMELEGSCLYDDDKEGTYEIVTL